MVGYPLQWLDAMGVGVDIIDADHKVLISLLNRSRVISETNPDPVLLGSILADMYTYLESHFEREEAVMEACHYPDLEKHRKAHSRLRDKVNALLNEPSYEESRSLTGALVHFLDYWLVDHIMGMDKAFEPWVEGNHAAIKKALNLLANTDD